MGTGIGRLREISRVGIGRLLASSGAQSPGASEPLGTPEGSAPRTKRRELRALPCEASTGSCRLQLSLMRQHSGACTQLHIGVTWKYLRQQCSGPSPTDSYLISLGLGPGIFLFSF